MFRDKNILMATRIWCWVGCCWKQRLCSCTRWNNYCTKPRNATSLRNASAASSAICRSQAGRPTSPTSQAGYLPTSVYLRAKALLGGAIGHRLDPADILRLSFPCCPWLPFPQLLWHYLQPSPRPGAPCWTRHSSQLLRRQCYLLRVFLSQLLISCSWTRSDWHSSSLHCPACLSLLFAPAALLDSPVITVWRELLMVLNDSLSSFGFSWFIYLLNNLTLLQFQHSTQYFLHVTVSHIICTMRRAKSIYHVPNPFNIIQLQTWPQMADIPTSEKWKYNMFLWIKVQHGQARKGSGFSILDMLSIICWQFFLSWKDKFEHNVKISDSLSCWCYCAP